MIHLNTFGKTRINFVLDKERQRATQLQNKKVKESREAMRRLIDAVYFFGKQELSFRGHSEVKTL